MPAGRDLYVISRTHRRTLQQKGLFAFPVEHGLWLVRGDPRLGERLGRKHGLSADLDPMLHFAEGWEVPEAWGRHAISPRPEIVLWSIHPPAELVLRVCRPPQAPDPVEVPR